MKPIIWVIIAIVVILIGGGIYTLSNKSYNSNQVSTTASQIGQNNIEIKNYVFSPSSLTIKIGDTITWTNNDGVSHTITSDSGSELDSQTISDGQTYSHTFNSAGTFNYHCSIHTGMKGRIIVE